MDENHWTVVDIPKIGGIDEASGLKKGYLGFAQTEEHFPFVAKRVFWITEWPEEVTRGAHAHKVCRQFFVVLHGSVRFDFDNGPDFGENHEATTIYNTTKGLYVPAMTWLTMRAMAPDTVLLCMCSEEYDEKDYVREWKDWLKLLEKQPA